MFLYTLWYILLNTLIVLGVVLAAAIVLLFAVSWSSLKFDIAANGQKALVTVSLWHIVRHTFEFSFGGKSEFGSDNDDNEPKEDEHGEPDEQESGGEKSIIGRFLGSDNEKTFRDDVKTLWNSEYNTFDFEALHDLIIKYAGIIADYKYGICKLFSCMRYKIIMERLDIYIRYGTGSPDKTGIAYGAMHAGVGSIDPLIAKYIKCKSHIMLYLDPDYVNKVFEFEVGAVFKLRLGHLINALIIAFVSYVMRKKNRERITNEIINNEI